jgi:hypothetical protein
MLRRNRSSGEAPTQLPAGVDVTPDIQDDIDTNVANVGKQTVADVLPDPFKSWNGLRPWLAKRGLTVAWTYQSDAMSVLSDGVWRNSSQFGRLLATAEWNPRRRRAGKASPSISRSGRCTHGYSGGLGDRIDDRSALRKSPNAPRPNCARRARPPATAR